MPIDPRNNVTDNTAGLISGFDMAFQSPLVEPFSGISVTLGSIIFHAVNPSDSDGPNDIRIEFLPNGIDVSSTVTFGHAEVVPEPATRILILTGLAVLIRGAAQSDSLRRPLLLPS